jgi:hypothetical protein
MANCCQNRLAWISRRTFKFTGAVIKRSEDVAGYNMAQPIPRSLSQIGMYGSGATPCSAARNSRVFICSICELFQM